MKRTIFLLALLAFVAGCGTVRKVESGTNRIGERLTVRIDGPWNHLDFPGIKPAQVWSMEGVTVDELLIYPGLADGAVMHPENGGGDGKKKNVVFRGGMQTEELVSMFEATLTRDDSIFKATKIEPWPFGGKKGFRFEFERIRKVDNVRQLGLGFGAVDKGQLFAMIYMAPRLTFFPRHKARIEDIARTATID